MAIPVPSPIQPGGQPKLLGRPSTLWLGSEPTLTLDTYPETRLGRLVMAAYVMVLAGTDEDGCSADLETAATLLQAAECA